MRTKAIPILLVLCMLLTSLALAACGPTPEPQVVEVEKEVTTVVKEEVTTVVKETVIVEATAEPAAAGGPKQGGTLYIGQDFGPQHFDPHKTTAWASINIYEHIYEGLVQWNEDESEIVPKLAESWEISDDGLVYTFKIRQGVKFHNGREMTAEDVKASLDRMRDPDSGSLVSATFNLVEAVEVPDDQTVQITLSAPSAVFLINLTERNPIVPPEAFDQLETEPVGTAQVVKKLARASIQTNAGHPQLRVGLRQLTGQVRFLDPVPGKEQSPDALAQGPRRSSVLLQLPPQLVVAGRRLVEITDQIDGTTGSPKRFDDRLLRPHRVVAQRPIEVEGNHTQTLESHRLTVSFSHGTLNELIRLPCRRSKIIGRVLPEVKEGHANHRRDQKRTEARFVGGGGNPTDAGLRPHRAIQHHR